MGHKNKKANVKSSNNELLPKNYNEFAEPEYWEKFNKQTSDFEWYGSYKELAENLAKYLKPSYSYLQIGCGNSNLASDLYDAGYKNITSIDIDKKSIALQVKKNAQRAELVFKECSVDKIFAEDKSFNMVLDKGTLDALLPKSDADESKINLVTSYFDEVVRVLKPFGLFIIVTLAQKQIVDFVTSYFDKKNEEQGFLVRIEKVEFALNERKRNKAGFPVYLFVITKLLKCIEPQNRVIEYKPTRLVGPSVKCRTIHDLQNLMLTDRQLQYFIEVCATEKLTREHTMTLYNGASGNPRFNVIVYDSPDVRNPRKYSIFIVPYERSNEYLFDCASGRQELLKNVGMDRLCMVKLCANEIYDTMDSLQNELGSFAYSLRPFHCKDEKVQVLSIGVDYKEKTVVAWGEGVNGPWEVQHLAFEEEDRPPVRRLVFKNISAVVQSEARILSNFVDPKNTVIDTTYLACEHHQMMLSSITFLSKFDKCPDSELNANFCVLGLGGGLLTTFLHDTFPKAHVTAVDIDPDVFNIAKHYFALPSTSERLKLVLQDALKFTKDLPSKENFVPFDVIFVDISGDYHVDGLVCPPAEFAKREIFENMKKCLAPEGVLAVNVVSRNKKSKQGVFNEFKHIFANNFVLKREEDINEILLGTDRPNAKRAFASNLLAHSSDETLLAKWISVKVNDLQEMRSN